MKSITRMYGRWGEKNVEELTEASLTDMQRFFWNLSLGVWKELEGGSNVFARKMFYIKSDENQKLIIITINKILRVLQVLKC